jgi:hypothetical protein
VTQEYGSAGPATSTLRAVTPTPDWRRALPALVAVFLLSRALVFLVAGALTAIPLAYDGATWTDRPILDVLTGSDAIYYLGIAAEGYHLAPVRLGVYYDWVFFPLFPMVVRAASILTLGDVAVAGVLVSNFAFGAALLALYALSVRYVGHDTAVRAAGFVALAPGAVAFAMAYSDSLFLLLAVGAFLAAERGRWPLAGLLYGLAALSRLPGVLLGLPLLLLLLRSTGRDDRLRAIPWLLAGPLALLAFSAWQGSALGDPLAFLHAQAAWVIPPAVGNATAPARLDVLPAMLIVILLFYTFLLVYLRGDRVPAHHALLAVVALLTVIVSLRLQSVARYLAVAWPFAWVLANRRAAWFREAWPYVTAGLFTLHAFLHFTQALAP